MEDNAGKNDAIDAEIIENKTESEKTKEESPKDDEFSFDLRKAFRRGKSEEEAKARPEKAKRKNWNFRAKKPGNEEQENEENFSRKGAFKFLKNEKISYLLLLIPIILTIFIRIQPNVLSITNDWAESSVYGYYRNTISAQVNSLYPNLPEENRQLLVEKQFSELLKTQGSVISGQVKETANFFKAKLQYDVNGKSYTYLGDLDSYFFLRYADNIVKYGRQGDILVNDTIEWDNHMTAPLGAPVYFSLHPYSIAWLYRVLKAFNRNMTTMQASFYTPLVFALIGAVAAFFIGKKLAGNTGAVITSVLVSVNPMFITRTIGSDTDVYNVVFPILIVWSIIEGFEAKNNKARFAFMGLTGLFMGIFSVAWPGWWYIFDFVMGAMGIYLAYLVFANYKREKSIGKAIRSKSFKNAIFMTAALILSSCVFVSIFSGFSTFYMAPIEPLNFLLIKEVVHEALWPNIYLTVAEMNPGTFDTILTIVGGWLFFVLSILGIIIAFFKKDSHGHFDIKIGILLIIWFFGTYYATLTGSRFSMLLVPAFAVAVGIAIGSFHKWLNDFASKEFKIEKGIAGAIIFLLFMVMLINPIKAGYESGRGYIPNMNDAWYDALTKIKNNSSQDAIINSWWDFGHWFKYVGDRAVSADGATQNRPQAYWLGRILATENEDEAIAVLRMLDCGATDSFDIVDSTLNDTEKSVKLLRSIIMMDRSSAEKELLKHITKEDAERVLKETHCNPPEDYLITSGDMIGKSGVWAHFGLWDFEKAKILLSIKNSKVEEAKKFMKEEFNYSDEQIERAVYDVQSLSTSRDDENWISPWPAYISIGGSCSSDNLTITCLNNIQGQTISIVINLTTRDAGIEVPQGRLLPHSFVYVTSTGDVDEKHYENPDFPYSIVLSSNNGYSTTVSSPELSKSIFTRLFFLNGAGLSHFELFDQQKELTGEDIYTWKVLWDGKK
ncbi:MAG: hypothetical protein NTV63_04080 [Candidatus Woesearchaeota archaeon]|nr:hypothetical protein [Candidatus Woesearchaeota archaeon]